MFGYFGARTPRLRTPRLRTLGAVAGSALVLSGLLVVTPTAAAAAVAPAESLQVPAAPAAQPVSTFDAFEKSAFDLLNRERAAAGLPALIEVPALDQVSTTWSTTLAGRGRFGSNAADAGFSSRITAAGVTASRSAQSQAKWYPTSVDVATIHGQLMANATISANIKSAAHRYVGLGRVESSDGTTALVLTFTDTVGAATVVDPVASASPTGAITSAVRTDDTVTLVGTASDPDASGPVTVTVRDTGTQRTWSGTGPQFTVQATGLEPGSHQLCVTAVNQNAGSNTDLGCVTATVPDPVPTGSLSVTGVNRASVSLTGQIDAVPAVLATAAVDYRTVSGGSTLAIGSTTRLGAVTVDGTGRFSGQYTVPDGPGEICLTATRPGQSTSDLACTPVTVPTRIIGNHDKLVVSTGQFVISGWAHDILSPTTSLTGSVTLTDAQGARTVSFTASQPRADVARVYPAAGELHGLTVTVPVRTTGQVTACVTVNPVQTGTLPFTFPCKTVTV